MMTEHVDKLKYMEESMLKIEHLSKNYGNKIAVDNLNLHIASGEFYCGYFWRQCQRPTDAHP